MEEIWLDMEHEKDKKKLFCKNIMCPCNNAEGDDGTAPLEEHYCLSGFCEYRRKQIIHKYL